jgi:branched-chain amino acid transport system substrate-binding protein
LVLVFGCAAPKAQTGIKPDRVVIHHFGDLSGPYAAITHSAVAGFEDFAEWFNAQGGIDGVLIEDKFRDTAGKLDAALAAYAAFKESEPYPIVTVLYGSSESEALRERFVEDKIFCFTGGPSPTAIYPPGYEFALVTSHTDSMGAWIDWVTGHWAKKTGQPIKLAILTWDSTFGRAILVPEVKDYLEKKGVEVVYEGVFGVRELDVATQMTAIKASGANWVYDNTAAFGPKVVHQAADALGMLNKDLYDLTPGKIHRASGLVGTDESMVNLSGELAEGAVGPRSYASWAMTDVEGISMAIAAADKHERDVSQRVLSYMACWAAVYTICHCMNNIITEQGWDMLNGEVLRAEMLKLKDFEPFGITKYTFSEDKPEPRDARIFQVQNGKLMPITDWVKCPDLRPSQYK